MANDITVTKNTTSGSERWDVEYTADASGTVTKTMDTAETILDRDIKVSVTIPSGSATTPATTVTANPTISVNSSTGVITATASATKSVTPTVSAGFVTAGTAGTVTVSGSNTSQLTTQAAQTIYPSTSDQTIASGKFLTGTQTVKGVLLTNLSASNIVSGVTVKVGDSADDDRIASVTGTASGGGGGTVTITDTTDSHGGTIRTITPSADTTTIVALNATSNTTYTAPTGYAYSPVTVNVSGAGGLEYEEGTYTPSTDTAQPMIYFANTHTTRPKYCIISCTNATSWDNIPSNTMLSFEIFCINDYLDPSFLVTYGDTKLYGIYTRFYRGSSSATFVSSYLNSTYMTGPNAYVGELGFCANTSTSQYYREGLTYKWLAVWKD